LGQIKVATSDDS